MAVIVTSMTVCFIAIISMTSYWRDKCASRDNNSSRDLKVLPDDGDDTSTSSRKSLENETETKKLCTEPENVMTTVENVYDMPSEYESLQPVENRVVEMATVRPEPISGDSIGYSVELPLTSLTSASIYLDLRADDE